MNLSHTLYLLPGIILGFTVHEYMHAKTAYLLGDQTAKLEGRVTLNPLKHLDLFGFLLLIATGFGWAKAVHFNPSYLKKPDRDEMLIAFAGPFSNIILAGMLALLLKLIYSFPVSNDFYIVFSDIIYYAIYVNVGLFLFNMIPIPPLDGSHILIKTLDLQPETEAFIYNYGIYLFFIIIFIDYQTDLNLLPIGEIANNIVKWMLDILAIG